VGARRRNVRQHARRFVVSPYRGRVAPWIRACKPLGSLSERAGVRGHQHCSSAFSGLFRPFNGRRAAAPEGRSRHAGQLRRGAARRRPGHRLGRLGRNSRGRLGGWTKGTHRLGEPRRKWRRHRLGAGSSGHGRTGRDGEAEFRPTSPMPDAASAVGRAPSIGPLGRERRSREWPGRSPLLEPRRSRRVADRRRARRRRPARAISAAGAATITARRQARRPRGSRGQWPVRPRVRRAGRLRASSSRPAW
jgi:hypothetical protein